MEGFHLLPLPENIKVGILQILTYKYVFLLLWPPGKQSHSPALPSCPTPLCHAPDFLLPIPYSSIQEVISVDNFQSFTEFIYKSQIFLTCLEKVFLAVKQVLNIFFLFKLPYFLTQNSASLTIIRYFIKIFSSNKHWTITMFVTWKICHAPAASLI